MSDLREKLADRFWERVAPPGLGDSCWNWTGAIRKSDGYALYCESRRGSTYAHRVAYRSLRGEIPVGLVLDHLCRNKRCVNPWHLEAVSQRTNVLRGRGPTAVNARRTICVNGHALVPENTGRTRDGRRFCRECGRINEHATRARRKSLTPAPDDWKPE